MNEIDFDITAASDAARGGSGFNSNTGVATIQVNAQSGLPAITQPVFIDGYTQPGAHANTLAVGDDAFVPITVAGTPGTGETGLEDDAGGRTVRGLTIENCDLGLMMYGPDNAVTGNVITLLTSDNGGTPVCGVGLIFGNGVRLWEATPSRSYSAPFVLTTDVGSSL